MKNIFNMFDESINYAAGETIIEKGDTGRDIYILTDGIVEISLKDSDENVVIYEMETPEMLGEVSFLDGTPRTATAKAKTDVEVFVLRYDTLVEEMNEVPKWFKMIIKTFTKRINTINSEYLNLKKENQGLKERLGE